MNHSLSFRKESIQRSSSVSEKLNQAQETKGMRAAGEPGRYSITIPTTSITMD
jgi:hypothetical protein